jgi:Tol biopolymer transport system component
MNADGTNQHAFPMLSRTQSPTWSPDSRKFAVVGLCGTTTFCLYIADADGGSVRSLPPSYFLYVGNWSPDGSKVLVSYPYAFASPNGAGMYAVDAASGATTLIHAEAAEAYVEYPAGWSPDGSKILYTRLDSSGQSLRVMNSDGTSDHLVLDQASTGNEKNFWSPNSARIAAMSSAGDAVNVLVVNVDGSGAKNLTSGTEWNQVTDLGGFSPDGKSVLFEESGGEFDIGQLVVARIDSQKRPEAVGVGQTPQWLKNGGIVFSTWLDINNYNSDVYSDPKVKS